MTTDLLNPLHGPRYHLVCKLVGASHNINGIAFAPHTAGAVKTVDPVPADTARAYLNQAGWVVFDAAGDEPSEEPEPEPLPEPVVAAAPPAPEPVKPAVARRPKAETAPAPPPAEPELPPPPGPPPPPPPPDGDAEAVF